MMVKPRYRTERMKAKEIALKIKIPAQFLDKNGKFSLDLVLRKLDRYYRSNKR